MCFYCFDCMTEVSDMSDHEDHDVVESPNDDEPLDHHSW